MVGNNADKREHAETDGPGDERARLLDPIDRIPEILFGLIMAVTIVGSLSIAGAGREEMRTVTVAALGCNIAWGPVDAVMYLVRTATARARYRALGRRIRGADPGTARRLIEREMPEHLEGLVGPAEIEGMRRHLLARESADRALLHPRDAAEAAGVFLLVVLATFPVVAPFLLTDDPVLALNVSRAITLAMLLLTGTALRRYAQHDRPLLLGLAMAVFGALLIAAVKALGGWCRSRASAPRSRRPTSVAPSPRPPRTK